MPPVNADRQRAVDDVPLWYHTMELAPGLITPGWFDLRDVLARLPWPEIRGRRCLDVATYDGHLAFELERRGAREVVATDIADHADWDWLPRDRDGDVDELAETAGEKGRGFAVAREILGAQVQRRFINVYNLRADEVGLFDVVVLGALLIHLRDPFRALAAVRDVCDGFLLSLEEVDPVTTALHTNRPLLRLLGEEGQWSRPNAAGHRRLLEIAGFDIITQRRYTMPLGTGHPDHGRQPRQLRRRLRQGLKRVAFGGTDVPMSAVLARVAVT